LLKVKSKEARTSVMGDSGKADVNFIARSIPKSEEVEKRIRTKLELSFMFSNLDDKEKNTVIGAMEEKVFSSGETIINQGDSGDELFILDSGTADCFKCFNTGEEAKYLKT
jgi:cAMP-dependent protein kinase regulator